MVEKVPEAAEEVISAAPAMVEPVPENVYAPSCEVSETDNNRNNRRNNRKNMENKVSISLNNTFKKFGLLGFNNKS